MQLECPITEKEELGSHGSGGCSGSLKGSMVTVDARGISPGAGRQMSTLAQITALLQKHNKLREEHADLQEEVSRERAERARLELKLQEAEQRNLQLESELKTMRSQEAVGESDTAVAVAVNAKDAEIAGLQRELLDLELQAQEELGEMHEELLEVRRSHQALELAFKESEQKRMAMQLQTQQMEQQLQETAGELAEAERDMHRRLQFTKYSSKPGSLPRAISLESDLGPGTPPALHPSRATQEQQPRPAYEALSHEFDAVMQELVQRKMELAELSEDYERVCHAFLKADEATNGPILAKLRGQGAFVRQEQVRAALSARAV